MITQNKFKPVLPNFSVKINFITRVPTNPTNQIDRRFPEDTLIPVTTKILII